MSGTARRAEGDGIGRAARYDVPAMPSPRPRAWWVYVVQRRDGALYTGIALDVSARFAAHCEGRGAKALRGRGPLRLVWRRRAGSQSLALRAEVRIKRLRPADKQALGRSLAKWRRLLAACERPGASAPVPSKRRPCDR